MDNTKQTKKEKQTLKKIQKELKVSDRKSREIKKLFERKTALEKQMFEHLEKQHRTVTDALDHYMNKG